MDSDPELEIIEKDSGMSSLGGSKDETPERRAVIVRDIFFYFAFYLTHAKFLIIKSGFGLYGLFTGRCD